MIDQISEFFHSLGRRGDAASSTGSAHAKLKDIKDNMPVLVSNNTPIARPDAATGVSVSTSATQWAYGSWTEIVAASVLGGHALSHILVCPDAGNWATDQVQVQVGEGGAGSEAAIGSWKIPMNHENASGWGDGVLITLSPLRQITANARVSVRLAQRDPVGYGTAWGFTVTLIFVPRPL